MAADLTTYLAIHNPYYIQSILKVKQCSVLDRRTQFVFEREGDLECNDVVM